MLPELAVKVSSDRNTTSIATMKVILNKVGIVVVWSRVPICAERERQTVCNGLNVTQTNTNFISIKVLWYSKIRMLCSFSFLTIQHNIHPHFLVIMLLLLIYLLFSSLWAYELLPTRFLVDIYGSSAPLPSLIGSLNTALLLRTPRGCVDRPTEASDRPRCYST